MSDGVRYLVLSSSLHPESRSRVLARTARARLLERGVEAAWLDASELDLPHCDGHEAWSHDGAERVAAAISEADGVLLAMGVYNYMASASAKTLVELGGRAWGEKVVGFLCAAGGRSSYMASLSLANALMLDFRSVIVPRFVYAEEPSLAGDEVSDPEVVERIDGLTSDLVRMTAALRGNAVESS